jgi:hypothetical protein
LYPPIPAIIEQHHRADDGKKPGHNADDDGLFWAAGMLLVIIGANLLAILCEINTDAEKSLLRGLGTMSREASALSAAAATTKPLQAELDRKVLNECADDDQPLDCRPPTLLENHHRRRATRIVLLRW